MRKNFLTAALFSFVIVLCNLIQAQSCTPNTSINTHGYYPASLDTATEGEMYSMTMHAYSKRDTSVDNPFGGGKVNATIDSIIVDQVIGLPAGIGYICNPANCRFVSLKTHCINLFGTPSAGTAGNHPLEIKVTAKATIAGGFKTNQEESIFGFAVFVKQGKTSAVKGLQVGKELKVYPNPSHNRFNFKNLLNQNASIRLYGLNGQLIQELSGEGKGSQAVDASKWANSLYKVIINYDAGITRTTYIQKI